MLYDRQTKTVTQLTTGQQAITQALFSADGKRIIYCAAGFYGSYSSIGPKAEHELDIFSVSLDGSARAQHTRLKAYFMGDLRLFKAPAIYLVNVNDPRQNLSGTYVLSLDAPEQLQLVSDEAVAARGLSYMPRFTVSAQGQVAFAIGNELFIKNMKTGRSEVVQIAIPLADPRPTAFVGETTMLIYERFPATSPKEEPSFQFSLLNLSNLSKTIIPLRTE